MTASIHWSLCAGHYSKHFPWTNILNLLGERWRDIILLKWAHWTYSEFTAANHLLMFSPNLVPSNQIPSPEPCAAKAESLNSVLHAAAVGSAGSAAPQGSGVICGIKVCCRLHTCSVLVWAGIGLQVPLPSFSSVSFSFLVFSPCEA